MRDVAYDHLNELKAGLPSDRPVFAAGDFNTTAKEDREQNMLDKHVRAAWAVAHELGCGDCKGTYYYGRDDTWSFLDMILWSGGRDSGAQATWNIRNNSVYVANGLPIQVRSDHTPARFQLPEGSGVSDHWPLVMSIELK
jgi:endonuclease/exonuclease/phosphatase family metal-dependent hydrolase